MTPPRRNRFVGFTLIELLVVMAIIGVLTSLCIPLTRSLVDSGETNTAIAQTTGTFEMARAYAMSDHTYVRVGMTNLPVQSGISTPSVALVVIAASDGSLTNDTAAAMANPSQWISIGKPIICNNLWMYNTINSSAAAVGDGSTPASAPYTTADATPNETNIVAFSRAVGSLGLQSFPGTQGGGIVQFNPAGEARVLEATPARFIKIGLDQPSQPNNPSSGGRDRNPFLLRISGINGSVSVERKEVLN